MKNVVQHPRLYFADGNIVLSAVSTTHNALPRAIESDLDVSNTETPQTVLFRVQKSLLTENSVIFRDMLELPEAPPGVNEEHDGVPVVQMSDSAKEVEDILKCFYRPWEMRLQKYHPDTCLQVMDILAMATKYQFTEIRQLIISHIEDEWPKTLVEWDWLEDFAPSIISLGKPDNTILEPAAALLLACRFGINRVLPAILYDLSRIYISDDWDKGGEKGTEAVIRNPYTLDWKPASARAERLAKWGLLNGDHL
ncbi:hypothetical protein M0805_001856 [Coniferiporia weirii]|nr:hypothetical protein M0805_001856 [Coniferiporia weirii]